MTSAHTGWSRSERILEPHHGYDLIAPYYERWHWFKFWRLNEAPRIRRWLNSLQTGVGLDAGSGTGPYVADIIKSGHRCIAADLSWQMLRVNRQKKDCYPLGSSVMYVQGNVSALPFKDSRFDWILCSRVLSHIQDIMPVLREFTRVLKPGSECLISDVHPNHPYTHMSISIDSKKISIETYKHPLEDLRRGILGVQAFQLVSLDEYYLTDLYLQPPRADFEKLYHRPNTAVFYICRLRRCS